MAFHETPFWEWLIQIIVGTIAPMSFYNLLVLLYIYQSNQATQVLKNSIPVFEDTFNYTKYILHVYCLLDLRNGHIYASF